LSRDELLRAVESLQSLDLNEDEWWTPEEIAPRGRPFPAGKPGVPPRWRRAQADSPRERQFLIRLGSRADEQRVVEALPPRLTSLHRRGEGVEVSLGTVKLAVEATDRPENGFATVRRLYLQEYQAADAEGRGFVERKHLDDAEFLRVLHRLAD